jgi:hypothetical protein
MRRGPAPHPGATGNSLLADDPGRRRGRRRTLVLTALVALVLTGVGLATYLSVRGHVINSLSEKLLTIQSSQEAAIRLWQQNERASVRGWAYEPGLRAGVLELTDGDGGGTEDDGDARAIIHEGLQGLLTAEDAFGYLVADRLGRILASSAERVVGKELAPAGIALLRDVLAGEANVTTPFVVSDFFYGDVTFADQPVVVKAAPVRNREREPVAALVVAVAPAEFSSLVNLGQFGETGETYAVSPRGWILSRSRMQDQLRELELVPDEADGAAVFAFQIRDPGGDMTRGFRPTLPASGLALTLAAASVTDGQSGINLEGYRDFRGVRVMGTWRWLEDLQLGLITEIDYREAMAPLKPLTAAFVGLFGLAAISAAGLVAYARIVERLRRRIDEVTQLGQYTLLEKIGEGGMGKVYRARHALLARDTAVKLLKRDAMSDEAIQRFEQEVQMTARLRHPNTVQIYDFGRTPEGIFYYAMEYLDGYDLARLIELTGPLPADRVVHILRQACRSLREAHAVGLIHRDIKPMNLIVSAVGGEYDVVKVLDFGLVKDVSLPDAGMTAMNVIPGTPPYIAPERMKAGAKIDGRVDIYALGAVAFNLLTGAQAYDGDTALDIAYKAMHEPPRRPSSVEGQAIPPALDDLVLAALARDPADRPADIETLLAALDRIAAALPWDARQAAEWWAAQAPPAAARDDGSDAAAPAAT